MRGGTLIQDDYRAAIDLGTTKVCTILGKKRSDGSIEVAGVGVVPCNGLKRGLVADPRATTEAVRDSVSAASAAAGMPISAAYLGLTGSHVESRNLWSKVNGNRGVAVVTQSDMREALSVASSDAAVAGRHVLHVIPRSYALDGIYGVRNPLGMHSGQMFIQTHAILGAEHPIESLKASVQAAGIRVSHLIVEPVAAAEAVLSETEREEGVILIDIGGGTTDIAVFFEGSIIHTAVLPVGGHQFTNDIAIAFDCSYEDAEGIKLRHASAALDSKKMAEEFSIDSASMDEPLVITRRELSQLTSERATELFKLVKAKLAEPHLEDVPLRHVVLTGGGSKLDGIAAIARYVLQGQVRTAVPRGADCLPEERQGPAYAASVGILLWGMRNLPPENHLEQPRRAPWSGDLRSQPRRMAHAVRGLLPDLKGLPRRHRTPVGT